MSLENKLTIITFSSMGQDVAVKLLNSAGKYGYPVEFYGNDEHFRDFRQVKIDKLLDKLRTVTTPYTMYSDAPDSWLVRGNVMRVYNAFFGGEVVVSGNRDHYPVTDLYDMSSDRFDPDSTFRYICSSQFMGPTKKLIELFEIMQKEYQGYVDQEGWHLMYVKELYPFVIDTQCRMFLNMTLVDADELDDEMIFRATDIKPCSIHFGGPKGDDPNAHKMAQLYERWQLLP